MSIRVDHLIVGAGPAGLQLAYYLQRRGADYVVLEAAGRPGSFFQTYPRHRQMISNNKVHTGLDDPEINLRFDWNSLLSDDQAPLFKEYSREFFPPADAMVRYLSDFSDRHGLRVDYDRRVDRIARSAEGRWVVHSGGASYETSVLVVATGYCQPYIPPIDGIELAEGYESVSTDADDFRDQRVMIIGKGNSAFETAQSMSHMAACIHIASPHPLKMAWKTHYVGHLRAINNDILDLYQLKSQHLVLDVVIRKIEMEAGRLAVDVDYVNAPGDVDRFLYDRVIRCTGFRFDDSIFDDDCRPALTAGNKFPEVTGAYESVNLEGVYFAGALMHSLDYRHGTSGFIHGFRYAVRALDRILSARHQNQSWPSTELPARPADVAGAILDRINRSSALWQQFAVIGDVVALDGDRALYYQEVPLSYLHDQWAPRLDNFVVVTLDYGSSDGVVDPFTGPRIRQTDVERASEGRYFHPIVRRYRNGQLVGEHHINENAESQWSQRIHREPLEAFLAEFDQGNGAPARTGVSTVRSHPGDAR